MSVCGSRDSIESIERLMIIFLMIVIMAANIIYILGCICDTRLWEGDHQGDQTRNCDGDSRYPFQHKFCVEHWQSQCFRGRCCITNRCVWSFLFEAWSDDATIQLDKSQIDKANRLKQIAFRSNSFTSAICLSSLGWPHNFTHVRHESSISPNDWLDA